jgi:AcrR family transcriptional regulator
MLPFLSNRPGNGNDTRQEGEKHMTASDSDKPVKAAKASTKREQREASTEKILRSSLKLFVSKGYRSTTVDEIAASAQLTKGAVYFYFPTKAAILLALLDEIEDLMVDKMVERVAHAGPLLQDKLIAFVHGQSVLGVDKAEFVLLFILMLLEFNGSNDEVEARVKSIYKRFYQSIEEIVHRGKLAGEFRTDLETH